MSTLVSGFLEIEFAANASIVGGNPSAEEMEEALEAGASQVNNVVHSFRFQSTTFDKKVRSFPVPHTALACMSHSSTHP